MRKMLAVMFVALFVAPVAMADRLGGVGGLLYASNTVFNASLSQTASGTATLPGAGSLLTSSSSVYDGATIRKFRLFQGERLQVLGYGSYNINAANSATSLQVSLMLGGSVMVASDVFTVTSTGTIQVFGGGQIETRETSTLGAQSTWWLRVKVVPTAAAVVAGTAPALTTVKGLQDTLNVSVPVAISSVPDNQRLSMVVTWSGSQTGGNNTLILNTMDQYAY